MKLGRDSYPNMSDDALWRESQSGDRLAFDALYERHFRNIYLFVRRRVPNEDVAVEVAQSTFCNVIDKIHNGSAEVRSSVLGYLYSEARGQVTKYRREHKRREQVRELLGTTLRIEDEQGRLAILREMYRRDDIDVRSRLILRAFHRLRTKHQEVLYARYVEGYDILDIVKMYGTSNQRGPIDTRLNRARVKFAEFLLEEADHAPRSAFPEIQFVRTWFDEHRTKHVGRGANNKTARRRGKASTSPISKPPLAGGSITLLASDVSDITGMRFPSPPGFMPPNPKQRGEPQSGLRNLFRARGIEGATDNIDATQEEGDEHVE